MMDTKHTIFSPRRIWAISSNTLTELIRLKVFYFLLLFALLIIGSSAFMVQFSFQEQFQVLKDVGLGAMSIFSWLLAVLATAMLLPKDIEDRTLYTILAKPVPRFEYLLGKLLGVLLLLLISIVVMGAMFALALYLREQIVINEELARLADDAPQSEIDATVQSIREATFSWNLVPGVVAIYLKAALFASLTLFISTFASSWIFTVIISVMIYLIGHVQGVAREYWLGSSGVAAQATSPLIKAFLALISLIFPDLQLFNLVDDIVVGNAVHLAMFGKMVVLGLLYLLVYLFVAYLVFSKKEL